MLTDGILTLRALEIIDVDTLYRWENDPELWSVGVTLAPYSRKQLWDYVNNYDGDIYSAGQLRLMIDLNKSNDTIGTIDLCRFDPANSRCEIGILIAKEHQRKGLGTKCLTLIEEFCRKMYSLHQLYCVIGEENRASRALFEKAGYKISGRLKSWLKEGERYTDAFIYQKFL